MRIVFMGTPQFAVDSLEKLVEKGHQVVAVVTQPDKPQGRGKRLAPPPIKAKALELNLTVYQPQRINEPGFIEILKELQPEVIVVVAFGQILPQEILGLPPLGCINVHASLLPKYRGAAPIHWAIINGEEETGVTTMLMDEGLDTGPMLLKESIRINETMTMGLLHDQLAQLGANLLVETLEKLSRGQLKPEAQNDALSSYAPLLTKEHEKINWQDRKDNIHNLVRGMNPWPGAYTLLKGARLKIWETTLEKCPGGEQGKAGEIIKVTQGGVWVQTGDHPLLLTKVQPAGKKVMSAVSFANGYGIIPGQYLGEENE
jgi:methionyl-tRNA formyltransferase